MSFGGPLKSSFDPGAVLARGGGVAQGVMAKDPTQGGPPPPWATPGGGGFGSGENRWMRSLNHATPVHSSRSDGTCARYWSYYVVGMWTDQARVGWSGGAGSGGQTSLPIDETNLLFRCVQIWARSRRGAIHADWRLPSRRGGAVGSPLSRVEETARGWRQPMNAGFASRRRPERGDRDTMCNELSATMTIRIVG
jgi:hypothetical protein